MMLLRGLGGKRAVSVTSHTTRYTLLGNYVTEVIEMMRLGVAQGKTNHAVSMDGVLEQVTMRFYVTTIIQCCHCRWQSIPMHLLKTPPSTHRSPA
jgi:hypothetical protein